MKEEQKKFPPWHLYNRYLFLKEFFESEKYLEIDLDFLPLSTGLTNNLKKHFKCKTLRELGNYRIAEILNCRWIGNNSLEKICLLCKGEIFINKHATIPRNKEIYKLRSFGWTFKDIGKKFRITGPQVRHLYLNEKRKLEIRKEEC